MKITTEQLPKSEIKIIVKLSEKATLDLKNKALAELAKTVKVTGFRPGHAPLDIVETQIGSEKVAGYILETNLPMLYTDAIKQEKLTPISRPNVEIISESPIEFSATFAVQPEVKVKDLDKIKIKKPSLEVSKKEFDEAVERLQKSQSEFKEVTRKSKKGDKVEIDFEGFDKEKNTIPGTKSENHPVVIGDNMFIPGFEENLLGLKTGDSHEFEVVFPDNYHVEDLKSKPVTFKITVKKVEESVLPEIDKEFAKKIFGEELEQKEFLAKLRHELEHQKIHDAMAQQEDDLFTTLLEKSDFEVSDILVEEETDLLLKEMQENISKQGLNFDDFVRMTELKENKSITEFYQPKAVERVKIRFIIDYIIRDKKIEATTEDFQAEVVKKIAAAPESVKTQIEAYYEKDKPGYRALKNQILLDKLFSMFIDRIEHTH